MSLHYTCTARALTSVRPYLFRAEQQFSVSDLLDQVKCCHYRSIECEHVLADWSPACCQVAKQLESPPTTQPRLLPGWQLHGPRQA